jgi:hypothetical protein
LKADVEILSTQVTPETARLAFLYYDDKPHAIIYTKDSKQINIDIGELSEYTSAYNTVSPKGKKAKVENTLYAEIFYPNGILQKGFCIIDTPGVEDPDQERSDVTLNFIDQADAVIFLIDPTEGGLKESELKFIKNKILTNNGTEKGIIFVANKVGALRIHQFPELPKLLANKKEDIKKIFNIDVKFYPIDSYYEVCRIREGHNSSQENDRTYIQNINQKLVKLNLPPDYFKDLFEEFKNDLELYLVKEKGKLFLKRRISTFLTEQLNPLIDELKEKSSYEPKSIVDLEIKIKDAEKQLEILKRKSEQILDKFNNNKNSLHTYIQQKTTTEFNNNITINPGTIDHLSADTVEITKNLSKQISKKTQNFINELIDVLEEENIKIERPNFDIRVKSIDTAKYFTKKQEVVQGNNDGDFIGAAIGGFLGFIVGGPLGAASGAAAGRRVGKGFNSDNKMIENVTFDEIGLRKEIDNTRQMLIHNYQASLDYYYNSVEETVDKILNTKKKSITDYYSAQKKNLKNEKFSFSQYRDEINSIVDKLNKNNNLFTQLLNEVETL